MAEKNIVARYNWRFM